MTTARSQTKGRDTHGFLCLPACRRTDLVRNGSVVSPFFRLKHCPETTETHMEERAVMPLGRVNALTLSFMIFNFISLVQEDNTHCSLVGDFVTGSTVTEHVLIPMAYSGITDLASLQAAIESAILTHASNNSYSVTSADIIWSVPQLPAALNDMPGAAVADAPSDAVTDYNVVTTVLGTLTGAVNTANTKQNEIATQLNTLLAELRSLGIIAI